MIGALKRLPQLWQTMGPQWLMYRMGHAVRQRSGQMRRRLPVSDWESQPLSEFLESTGQVSPESLLVARREGQRQFFFKAEDRPAFQQAFRQWGVSASPIDEAEAIGRGVLRYFSHAEADVGFPPAWHTNPFTGQGLPSDRHWSEVGFFGGGDIKYIWEPSRFGMTYPLVRAYWRSEDEQYAEAFWQLVQSWREENPPQQGANWKCGQEASLRLMAWCFGLYGFLESPHTTSDRVGNLIQMIAVSAVRVEATIDYALSQQNNHGMSEAMGLWTTGILFPELSSADRWERKGRELLERLGRDLVYDDGAFSQHSMNYHRVMLQLYLWCLRLGDIHERPFSEELRERVGQAARLLYEMQCDQTGRLPNYGGNDGAWILPLSGCDYSDYRPVLQAMNHLTHEAPCYDRGAWDEDSLWLFGASAIERPAATRPRSDLKAEVGGYYTQRTSQGFAFMRSATFRHRPAQADMLHLDLWWRGENVALDPGAYTYNGEPPWDEPFMRTAHHNTASVDALDQMDRAGRFMWLPWLTGEMVANCESTQRSLAYWEAGHDGYRRLAKPTGHRRAVLRIGEEHWLVLDRLVSDGPHAYRLHWLLSDVPYEADVERGRLALDTEAGRYQVQVGAIDSQAECSLVRGDETSPRGWYAPCYGKRAKALSLALVANGHEKTFWSLLGPGMCEVQARPEGLQIQASSWSAEVQLSGGLGTSTSQESDFIVRRVELTGELSESLEIQ